MDRLELGRRGVLFEVKIPLVGRKSWIEELRGLPGMRSAELIEATESSEVYRLLSAGRSFLPLLKRLNLILQHPIPLRGEFASWTVVGAEGRIRQLLAELKLQRVAVELQSIQRGTAHVPQPGLTRRQWEVLVHAADEGYFDVPRRISLTGLAARMNIAPSTLSVALAVIEKKVIESILRTNEASLAPAGVRALPWARGHSLRNGPRRRADVPSDVPTLHRPKR